MNAGKPIIGLTGGIGSGKSTVAALLEELGAAVIASDRLNHEELDSAEVQDRLRQWWGDSVIGADGHTDRTALRRIVKSDPHARRRLEALVHPRIAGRRDRLMETHLADPSVSAIVWDSPLLLETGLDRRCDCIIFVETDEAARVERVARDRGWTAEELEAFEKSQQPLDFKRDRADHRVVNNSDIDDLRRQVKDIFSRIRSGIPDS